jgi:hypothetical protein
MTLRSGCFDVGYDFCIITMFSLFYPQLFVGGLPSYLCYFWLLAYSDVQHILCCVFVLCFSALCNLCYQFLSIAPSVFYNVYLTYKIRYLYICFSFLSLQALSLMLRISGWLHLVPEKQYMLQIKC